MPGTDLCVEYSVGASLKLNAGGLSGTTTTIRTSSITGLDGRPVRRTIWPQGASDGGILGTGRFGARLITVTGDIIVYSGGEMVTPVDNGVTAYLTGVNTLVASWISGLEGLINTNFTLAWTPTGGSAQSLTCRYGFEGSEFQSTPSPDLSGPTTVTFGLVAASG